MLGNIEEIKQGKILDQLLLSSKIGDGHYEKYATSSMFQAVAKRIDYISLLYKVGIKYSPSTTIESLKQ